MPNRDTQQQEFPAVKMVLGAIADWINRYRAQAGLRDELGQCDPAEVARIAQDLNLAPAELHAIAGKGPGSADNLKQMLIALKVDPATLANREPGTMRDLQRLCINCDHKQQCGHELDIGSAAAHFHEFCPNAYTLDALLKADEHAH